MKLSLTMEYPPDEYEATCTDSHLDEPEVTFSVPKESIRLDVYLSLLYYHRFDLLEGHRILTSTHKLKVQLLLCRSSN